MDALRKDLALALGVESPNGPPPKKPEVAINRLNGHILVKVCSIVSETQALDANLLC
jgi:large subunit ribosomal protein L49